MLERGSGRSARGVLYFNRVPTNVMPSEIREVFAAYGTILRQRFLSSQPHQRAATSSATKRKLVQCREGWLEYADRDAARRAADEMHAQPVVCKHKRKCYGENWCCKFLEGFTWDDLLSQKEETSREQREAEVREWRTEASINDAFRRSVLNARRVKQKRPRDEDHSRQADDSEAVGDATTRVGRFKKKEHRRTDLPPKDINNDLQSAEKSPKKQRTESRTFRKVRAT